MQQVWAVKRGGYWWECTQCGDRREFPDAVGTTSLGIFIRTRLQPAGWPQAELARPCRRCERKWLRVTYQFPREDHETVHVFHIVGLSITNTYLAMMWETMLRSDPRKRIFHFNYMEGNGSWGLNKAAVLSRRELRRLFALYSRVTGRPPPC